MTLSHRTVRSAAALVLAAAAALPAAGIAEAATASGPGTGPVSSACRPGDHRATVTRDGDAPNEIHYRISLTAAPGTAPCTLDGAPTDLAFTFHGRPVAVRTGPAVRPGAPVTFGPDRPVHVELIVADNTAPGSPADEVALTLPGIPGRSVAQGRVQIVGQVHPDAIAPGA